MIAWAELTPDSQAACSHQQFFWADPNGGTKGRRVLVLAGGGAGGGCVSLLSRVCVSVYGEPWLRLHTQIPCVYNL